jgi:L-ascorbate metabolism protein UlaG (beta-lactamase superfamily)
MVGQATPPKRACASYECRMPADHAPVSVQYLGGPTAILEFGGVRLLIDPTFDPPGTYPIGERALTKTAGPAVQPEELGRIDAILLSHDQHPDNLDRRGRAYLAEVPVVFSTPAARDRLGEIARPLAPWQRTELATPTGATIALTAVPALHGPAGSEHLVGEVTGFVVSAPGLPRVYISGDNASLDLVRAIADRLGPFEIALLFAGAAQTPLVPGGYLTLTSDQAADATVILGAPQVVPLHFEGWGHFTQGADTLRRSFERAGLTELLHLLAPGARVYL